ncbi:hypothetical protein [Methylobacterium frigidaeris]|uniref:hypothetical protein n=1 Tax=Methylobacterium frigidaeris TaxID=2038277 RepID=UPI001EDDF3EE|nr:hypothetical protein [Methylobacterium frigidaeris]
MDVIARELHEHSRSQHTWWPAWEDLDPADSWQAELIRIVREKAREFIPADDPAA